MGIQISNIKPARPRLDQLDALRGLCALVVVAYHFEISTLFSRNHFIHNGYLLVDFFFVLSGFVMFYNYSQLATFGELKRFMLMRFFRLYPLHLLMLFVFLAYEVVRWAGARYLNLDASRPAFTDNNLFAFVLNITLLNGVGFTDLPTFNVPSWTISAELWTYLAFACLAVLSVSWNPPARGMLFSAGSALSALLLCLVVKNTPLSQTGIFALPRCGFSFFLGVLVCSIVTYPNALAVTFRSLEPSKRQIVAGTLLQVFCLAASAVAVARLGRGPYELAIPFFYAATIISLCWFPGALISRLAKTPLFLRLGRYSYSIYMVHLIFVLLIEKAVRTAGHVQLVRNPLSPAGTEANYISINPVVGTLLFALCLVTVLVISHLTFTRVEEPWRLFGKRWISHRDTPSEKTVQA